MAKIILDDETTAALTLFNEYVAADRERTQREKRLKKAERAKDDAAALVKKLSKGGSSKDRSEAEATYRAAAEKWKALRDGKEPPADSQDTKATKSAQAEVDETETKPEAEVKAKAETEPEAEVSTEPEAEPEAKAEVESEAQTDDKTETEPATEPEATAETEPEAEPKAESEPETETEAEADDESESSEKPAE